MLTTEPNNALRLAAVEWRASGKSSVRRSD